VHLFFADNITSGFHQLDPEESRHCARVLRLREGSRIFLTDGRGCLYTCIIQGITDKTCKVEITNKQENYGKRDYRIHIAIAPTKNSDRFEWFAEKAVEMGIDEITPLICEHSERIAFKPERIQKIMVSAMKQSLQAYLPVIHPAMKAKEFIQKDHAYQKFIAYLDEGNNRSLTETYVKGDDALILIGPEGDFSGDEIILAKKYNFASINLGKTRLRTETAAMAACHTINLLNE
jgi:16S rRNA (uracil1498-N3)-methyltransferase